MVNEIKAAEGDLEKVQRDLVRAIEEINAEITKECGTIISNEDRNSWVNTKTKNLEEMINSKHSDINIKINNLESKIDDLLNYLGDYLNRDQRL